MKILKVQQIAHTAQTQKQILADYPEMHSWRFVEKFPIASLNIQIPPSEQTKQELLKEIVCQLPCSVFDPRILSSTYRIDFQYKGGHPQCLWFRPPVILESLTYSVLEGKHYLQVYMVLKHLPVFVGHTTTSYIKTNTSKKENNENSYLRTQTEHTANLAGCAKETAKTCSVPTTVPPENPHGKDAQSASHRVLVVGLYEPSGEWDTLTEHHYAAALQNRSENAVPVIMVREGSKYENHLLQSDT